ncbi:MAG: hypothetical protein NTW85_14920 [Methylococcales bacterium]|nr:hypothetical protein [Methylococcales bacterium]
MTIDKELKKFESQYYRMFYEISFNTNAGKWMGKVRIVRKDTDEAVRGGFRVFDVKKNLLKKKMIEKIHSTLETDLTKLGVPYEWNSKGRLILVLHLRLMDSIVEFGKFCDDTIAGKESSNYFTEKYVHFWYELIKQSIAIARSIELLTPQERIEMLTSPDYVYDDPSDPWNLDDLDARLGVFKFFLNPSEMEISTLEVQTKKITDLHHKLGWDKLRLNDDGEVVSDESI